MTEKQYAYIQERFLPYEFYPVQYGHGVWYDPTTETYEQAIDRARQELNEKVHKDFQHLIPPTSTELPTIDYSKDY